MLSMGAFSPAAVILKVVRTNEEPPISLFCFNTFVSIVTEAASRFTVPTTSKVIGEGSLPSIKSSEAFWV